LLTWSVDAIQSVSGTGVPNVIAAFKNQIPPDLVVDKEASSSKVD
jgi:hypothetical protein